MSDEQKVELRTVNELLGYNYYIPAYQRGYRWGASQVKALLDDIYDFEPKDKSEFYCLQPLMVKARVNGEYEVIDGQQRLTTIALICGYLQQAGLMPKTEKEIEIEYETRKESAALLANTTGLAEVLKNWNDSDDMDFYHIGQAHEAITKWFHGKKDGFNVDSFLHNVKVIWYVLAENADKHKVFQNANAGKIPLNNAELIRAQFLQSSASLNKDERDNLADDWDDMECQLNDASFWSFLKPSNDNPPRIGYLFSLMEWKHASEKATYWTFAKWQGLVDFFAILNAWNADRKLYNLIGFMRYSNMDKVDKSLVALAKAYSADKTAFDGLIMAKIKTHFTKGINGKTLEQLSYWYYDEAQEKECNDQAIIKDLLLLFNIQSTPKGFDFAGYRAEQEKGSWSLEHVNPQRPKSIKEEEQPAWLVDHKKFLSAEQLATLNDEQDFEELATDILTYLSRGANKHTLGNLALLDSRANAGLNNRAFPLKKDKIKRYHAGLKHFIPSETLKIFSENEHWYNDEQETYIERIADTLEDYLPQGAK